MIRKSTTYGNANVNYCCRINMFNTSTRRERELLKWQVFLASMMVISHRNSVIKASACAPTWKASRSSPIAKTNLPIRLQCAVIAPVKWVQCTVVCNFDEKAVIWRSAHKEMSYVLKITSTARLKWYLLCAIIDSSALIIYFRKWKKKWIRCTMIYCNVTKKATLFQASASNRTRNASATTTTALEYRENSLPSKFWNLPMSKRRLEMERLHN